MNGVDMEAKDIWLQILKFRKPCIQYVIAYMRRIR